MQLPNGPEIWRRLQSLQQPGSQNGKKNVVTYEDFFVYPEGGGGRGEVGRWILVCHDEINPRISS